MPSKPSRINFNQDRLLNIIDEASRNARRIYLLFIGVLFYCLLTVLSTTDRQIVFNEPAQLPVIKIGIPLHFFFLFSPLLVIVVFIYLQLYLSHLNKLLKKVFKKGGYINKDLIYPWLINISYNNRSGAVGKIMSFFVSFSLWWFMPIVLGLNAFWYLKKHEPVLSILVSLFPLIGLFISLFFWNCYDFRINSFNILKPEWFWVRSDESYIR